LRNSRTGGSGPSSRLEGGPGRSFEPELALEASEGLPTPPEDLMTLPEFVRVAMPTALPAAVQWLAAYALLSAVARVLKEPRYGAAVTSVAIFLIVEAFIRPIDRAAERGPELFHRQPRRLPRFFIEGTVAAIALGALLPSVSIVFHLPFGTLALLLPSVFAALLRKRWKLIPATDRPLVDSFGVIVAGSVAQVLAGVALVALGLGVAGVLLALFLAELTKLLLGSLHRRAGAATSPAAHAPRVSRALTYPRQVLAPASFALLANADLLLARHLLPGAAAGEYAAAAVVARVLLFIPAIAGVALAGGVLGIRSTDPFRWLREWLVVTISLILVAGAGLVLFRGPILGALVGTTPVAVSAAFPIIAAGVGFLAIVWQLSSFHSVVDSRAHLLTLFGVLLEVVLVALLGASDHRIAAGMLGAAALTAVLLSQAAWAIARWSPPLSLLRPHEEVDSSPEVAQPRNPVELSIIVPCHNAGSALTDFLARLEAELTRGASYEIIVVSDGSTDETLLIARELASSTLRVVHYPQQAGKGHALRVGLNRARGQYVGFIDSDGDIDPQAVGPFLSLMKLYEPDVVLGSKRHPLSQVAYPPMRRVLSWIYHKLTRILFRVNVRDTQTGLKVVRRDVLATVLPRMFEKRYAWDLELLVVARTLGFTRVFEAPVRIQYRFSSQVNPNAAFRIILDTLAIFYRRYILDSYRHTAHRLAVIRERQERA
jgi:hypothetical protein